jgi:Zn-dependent protease with chaperone function
VSFEPRLPRDDVNVSKTHPLAEAGWLLGAAALAGLLLALLAFALTETVSRWLPAGVEARVFGEIVEEWSAEPPAEEPARAAAARALLARLATRWPDNPYAFRLIVADEDALNAFALPGGAIVVTQGLLDAVESENELAFVLGHEIGHFAARDHLRAIGRGVILSLMLRSVTGTGAGDAVPALSAELASRGFARDQERDADAFALGLVAAEYGHAGGADHFFRRLPDAEAGFGARTAAWFATHPVSESRIAALRDRARSRRLPLDAPLAPLPPPGAPPGDGVN